MSQPVLILLPGFGTDHRLFEAQLAVFENACAPLWMEPVRGEALDGYAARLSDWLAEKFGDAPLVIAGVSMGGMIALELGKLNQLNIRQIVMIGSCDSPAALDRGQRCMANIVQYLPLSLIAYLQRHLPTSFFKKLGPLSPEQAALTRTMFQQTPTPLIRWGVRAMARWDGVDKASLEMPLVHWHGDRDTLIVSSRVQPDVWIEGGAHALSVTHADSINQMLADVIKQASK